jgi:hypothetical protein
MTIWNIERITESTGATKGTHEHLGYRRAFADACRLNPPYDGHVIVDLFARMCPWGTIRNDLNPTFKDEGFTTHAMDAIALLKTMEIGSADIILLDPPFSDRMNQDKYGDIGPASLYTNPKYMSDLGEEIGRVLRAGGILVKAGFNSNRPHKNFGLCELYLSHYGASRNDVIFSVWENRQSRLPQRVCQ